MRTPTATYTVARTALQGGETYARTAPSDDQRPPGGDRLHASIDAGGDAGGTALQWIVVGATPARAASARCSPLTGPEVAPTSSRSPRRGTGSHSEAHALAGPQSDGPRAADPQDPPRTEPTGGRGPPPDLAGAVSEHRELIGREGHARSRPIAGRARPRPGDPDRGRELRARAGWSWLRVFRRYDDYRRAVQRLESDSEAPSERELVS